MSTLQMPRVEHQEFDEICEPVDEFEHLPAVKVSPWDESEQEKTDEDMDGLILAGLVAPY
jgi:hypothetical protein